MGDDEGLIKNLDDAWNINYDDLEFTAEIGRGGFGSVYKGEYFGTPVAIKRIVEEDPDGLLYLEREVNVLKGMRHPNIVQFIGISLHESGLHICTEYVKNGNLRTFLKDHSVEMPWTLRVLIAHDVACAMAYLHSRNVIHRDLKSKNLLVGDNWKIKVCDFGFARTAAANRPMTLCGTDDWMAPEVILGLQYDNKIDVFSYGVVLVELISRIKISTELQRKPTDAFGLDVTKFKSLIPSECPPDFAQLAIDCCSYEPKERPAFKDIIRRIKPIMKYVSEQPSLAKPLPSLTGGGGSAPAGPAGGAGASPAAVKAQPARVGSSSSGVSPSPKPNPVAAVKPQPVKTFTPAQPKPTPVQSKPTPVQTPKPQPIKTPVAVSVAKPQPIKTPVAASGPKPVVQSTAVAKPATNSGTRAGFTSSAPPVNASTAPAAVSSPGTDRSNRGTIKFGETKLKKSTHNLW